MKLKPLEIEDCIKILETRNNSRECLRTPYMLTREMQKNFYIDVVSNRNSNSRYFAIEKENSDMFLAYLSDKININIGFGELENIQWENSHAELGLLIYQEYQNKGYGVQAVELLLNEGFNNMNLNQIWLEYYLCANVKFWEKIGKLYKWDYTRLPERKFWQGKYYDSIIMSLLRKDYIGE